jgi:hypothetical protein
MTGTIPSDIFSTNTLATDFSYVFRDCSTLTGSMPTFVNNTLTSNFIYAFYNCSGLNGTIPSDAFSSCLSIPSFQYSFYNCSSLTGDVPSFGNNTTVLTFNNSFRLCSSLTGIAANAFVGCTSVTNFTLMLMDTTMNVNSQSLWLEGDNTLIPPNYDVGTPNGQDCYRNGNFTDQATIPTFWK